LRDLDNELSKLANEMQSSNLSSLNIQEVTGFNNLRSHVMMCEDTADMMLSRESPSVRLLMKRTIRELVMKPKTQSHINIVADTTEATLRIAKAFGLEGNQAYLKADKATKELTGVSPIALLGLEFKSPNNEKLLTPTEIRAMQGRSAQAVNKQLEVLGFQAKIDKVWHLTDTGKQFGVYLDTGKTHSNGTPIQQIKWKESIIPIISAKGG